MDAASPVEEVEGAGRLLVDKNAPPNGVVDLVPIKLFEVAGLVLSQPKEMKKERVVV